MARVIIVSNRLPVSVKKTDGKLEFSQSTGGVATGLASYAENPRNAWIGWPGIPSDDLTESEQKQVKRELAKHNCIPVFMTKKQIDSFYNGYSNTVLWPLFHDLDFKTEGTHDEWWHGYQQVNKMYADLISKEATKNSRIWVHDYQLLLVPQLLQKAHPTASIGFFLHIPFPSPSSFTKLPEAKKLLTGMLGAQLLGFHTHGYVNNYLDTAEALDVGTVGHGQIILGDRSVRVVDFPMGIDVKKYAESAKSATVKKAILKYKLRYRGMKVIVAVDRLDPSKGLVERLQAYREFLRRNPKLHKKVVLSMVAAPSRTDIDVYRKLGDKLGKLAAEINEEFGTKRWKPIDYMNYSIPFEEVSALMHVADVAFIAPIRDGMNLVAKEYVASRQKTGVLILSETAGAAQELSEALLVNPARPASVVKALEQSLTMPKRELKKRFSAMKQKLAGNTVHNWANTFMNTLQKPVPSPEALLRTANVNGKNKSLITQQYSLTSKRLILLDYDGTLKAHTGNYDSAAPPKQVVSLLKRLAKDDRNEVVVVSGRDSSDLEAWFGDLPISLVAEHGALSKAAGNKHWKQAVNSGRRWKKVLLPVLETYTARTPKARIEEKQYSLVWHYRQSPAFAAQKNLQILQRVLRPLASQFGLALFNGSKILEIKDPGINKGNAVHRWIKHEHDFVLVMGDDFTDEDMFAAAPPSAVTIKVGRGKTLANYRVQNVSEVLDLLQSLKSN